MAKLLRDYIIEAGLVKFKDTVREDEILREFFDISKFSSKHIDIVYKSHDVLHKLNYKNTNPSINNCHRLGKKLNGIKIILS